MWLRLKRDVKLFAVSRDAGEVVFSLVSGHRAKFDDTRGIAVAKCVVWTDTER